MNDAAPSHVGHRDRTAAGDAASAPPRPAPRPRTGERTLRTLPPPGTWTLVQRAQRALAACTDAT
ncbi:hypothetical protein, partial [Kineococcus glutinatus]|uniref:hypothetical protein n=1 Tax=Kineococcus glutinatus TaxID=1070872 RepID=UPI0031EC0E8D